MRNRISRLWLVNKHDCEHQSRHKEERVEREDCKGSRADEERQVEAAERQVETVESNCANRRALEEQESRHQVKGTRCPCGEEQSRAECVQTQHHCSRYCCCLRAQKRSRTIVHVLFIKSCYNQILEVLLVLFLVICLTSSLICMPSVRATTADAESSSRERGEELDGVPNYGVFSLYNVYHHPPYHSNVANPPSAVDVSAHQAEEQRVLDASASRVSRLIYSQLDNDFEAEVSPNSAGQQFRESHSIGGSAFGYNGVQVHHHLEDFAGAPSNLSRSQNFKINPKPCSIGLLEGTCMFVWECIKSEGRHMGMCVDSFMFGSCCAHNYTDNIVLPNSFSYTRPTKPSGLGHNNQHRPPPPIHRPIISGMTTIERPHGAGTLVIRPSGPHHQSYLSKPLQSKPSHSTASPTAANSSPSLGSSLGGSTSSDYSILHWIQNNTIQGITHANTGAYPQYWHLTTEPNFITKPRPHNWDKPIVLRPKPSKPTKKPINSTLPFYTTQYQKPNEHDHLRPPPPVNGSVGVLPHLNGSHISSGKPMKPMKPLKPSAALLTTTAASSSTVAVNGGSTTPFAQTSSTTIRTEPATIEQLDGKLPNNQQQQEQQQQQQQQQQQLQHQEEEIGEEENYQQHGSGTTWPSSYNSKPTSNFIMTTSSDFAGKPMMTTSSAIILPLSSNGNTVDPGVEMRPTTTDVMTTIALEMASSTISTTTSVVSSSTAIVVPSNSPTTAMNVSTSSTTTTTTTTIPNSSEDLPEHLLSTLESNEIVETGDKIAGGHVIKTVSAARSECGIPILTRPETRIVGGKSAVFGRWPWQVSVRRTSFFGFSSTHRCGGALLNENWIATAGHCVDDLLISQIRIRVGEYDFSHVQEQLPYIEKGVLKKIVHPQYNFFTYEYDLALVKLEQSLEFAPHVSPICLPQTESLLIGMNATVTGWGRLSEGGTLPSVLQEVSVPIVSNDNCKSMFLRAGRQEFIPEIFLCAGHETGGQDSCQGDSGGPLQVKSQDGRYFLAGIISWGIGCAEANLPGVCTRISKFVPWIMMNVT